MHCQTWNMKVNPGQRIRLTFESFDLESSSSCKLDFLQISFDSVEEKYCGSNKPRPIISSGNTMRIIFHSDDTDNGNGFRAIWEVVEEGKMGMLTKDASANIPFIFTPETITDYNSGYIINCHRLRILPK